jgi:hypothetical protein
MPIAKRLLPLTLALVVAGCAGPSTRHRDAPLIAEASERSRNGDYAGASQIYQRLAEQSNDADADYFRLLAADAELRSGNDRAARALLGAINAEDLEQGDQLRYALLRSRLDLNQGKAREAMARLDAIDESRLSAPLRANYHHLRASAYNQMGNMLECARERVYYGQLITNNPEAVQKNNEGIYDALNRVPYAVLTGMQASTPGTLGGWMALVIALRGPEADRTQAVQAWRASHPGHPANGAFVEGFLAKKPKAVEITPLKPAEPPAAVTPPPIPAPAPPPTAQPAPAPAASAGFIGVMLPLTGQYAVAAQAMRAGLMAAWNADTNPAKPELRFADTQSGDIGAAYRKFADEGAKYVIGPLTKEEVAALSKLGELPVPTLALNQSPEAVPRDGLYQFALTPEQEIEQAASLAWFDARQSALLLAPANAFGQRMINHFSNYWKSLGGRIAAVKTYPPGAADYSDTARQLLAGVAGADAGQSRPEFIFLIADSRDGRLLNPHIKNQAGGNLPIYATSQIFNGQPNAPQNQDLSGVTFCDSPWLLGNDNGPLSRQALQAEVQQTPALYLRLLPMGIDAYRLLPELAQLKAGGLNRYDGASGVLSLKAGNRIQRQLHCAQFEGASLQQRGIAPSLQPSTMPGSP